MRTWRTTARQLFSHKGRMYELFYRLSKYTDWMLKINKLRRLKGWIDRNEYHYWAKWVRK